MQYKFTIKDHVYEGNANKNKQTILGKIPGFKLKKEFY